MQLRECEPPCDRRRSSEEPRHFALDFAPEAGDAEQLRLQVRQLEAKLLRHEALGRYEQLQRDVVDFIQLATPRGSTVLVVSRGDERLVESAGRRAWHFPQAADGQFAGCYPANSKEAVEQLAQLQSQGAEYLAFPSTSYWWLDFYRGLARHLKRRHRLIAYHEAVCLVFRLISDEHAPQATDSVERNGRSHG